jgi:lipid-A-disaccharide synthase
MKKFRKKHPELPEIPVEVGKTAYYQQAAGTGLAASGTVTVESAIAGLPLAVVYRVNWLSLMIAAVLVKLYRNSFVMPNIIANKKVYEEFLQHQVVPKNLVPAMERILPGGAERQRVISDMQEVRQLLGDDGAARKAASERAAETVWKTLDNFNDK